MKNSKYKTLLMLTFILSVTSCKTEKNENPILIESINNAVNEIPQTIENAGNPPHMTGVDGQECIPEGQSSSGTYIDSSKITLDAVIESREAFKQSICGEGRFESQSSIYSYCYKVYDLEGLDSTDKVVSQSLTDYPQMQEKKETFQILCERLKQNLGFMEVSFSEDEDYEFEESRDRDGDKYISYMLNGVYYTDRYPLSEEAKDRVVWIKQAKRMDGNTKRLLPGLTKIVLETTKKIEKRVSAMKKQEKLCRITSSNAQEDNLISQEYNQLMDSTLNSLKSIQRSFN